ncbi:MAG TPA: glycosyltransferase family 2 protein [Roseiarcus sp.]|nr:glycosyltransferase family 2 protein [Roseiarcus sp.]
MKPVYSIVIPVYNEEAVLPILLRRLDGLIEQFDAPAEVIFVDDGSSDTSAIVCEAKARADHRYRYVRLSRNFGHQIAITSGMDLAAGDAVIVMDADLQDPPEVVLEMISQWKRGYEVVCGERLSRAGESSFKKATADLFYRLIANLSPVAIPRNVGDFRLVDRKVVDSFRAMPERDRLVRGMFAWLGFKQTVVQFHRSPRAAGETKYPLRKMARLAVNGLVSFSDAPLRVALWAGMGVSMMAMLYAAWVIAMWAAHADLVPGWSSTIIVVAFLGGANMMMTGVMGLYVGRIHAEVKNRPLYIVDKMIGFDNEAAAKAEPSRKIALVGS